MKTILLTAGLLAVLCSPANGQNVISVSPTDSLANFDTKQWTNFYWSHHTSVNDLPEFIYAHQRAYIHDTYFSTQRLSGQNPIPQQACTNIDFESGNLNGWTTSQGFNPIFNPLGCCQTAGGAQQITTGAGVDACGGFPVIAAGGNFSVRLGNNGTGGLADRLEQTFNVTAANANFTYRYAVVFEDPGHALADQPKFEIQMLDSNDLAIPCTFYNVAAGQNIPGFINSPNCANVVYKPWTNVSVDLTNYIGQDVTIRFTTYDCSLGGHYAYAYIDGSCIDFNITQNGILCQGSNVLLNAPVGFASYNWTLPNGNPANGQLLSATTGGVYTLSLTTVTGCPGPTMTYTLTEFPKPNAIFTVNQLTPCTQTISFNNNSNVVSGNISSYAWTFGDGTTGNTFNATHNYANSGNYNAELIAITNMGCRDTMVIPVAINPTPLAAFSASAVCANSASIFINTSSVNTGSISSYGWLFGDGATSSLAQPNHQYANAGTYNATLNVTTNAGCNNSVSHPVNVNALPNTFFAAPNVCDGFPVNFTNNSTIVAGTITNYSWDFDSDGIADNLNQSPTHHYTSPGTYTAELTVVSNNNCSASYSSAIVVHPLPVVQFSAANVCEGIVTAFTNQSTIIAGQVTSYNWTFGDNSSATVANPNHTYSVSGNYSISLTATSNFNCVNVISGNTVVHTKPTVQFSVPAVCYGLSSGFINQSTVVGGQITNYNWTFGDNTASALVSPSHSYLAAGTYSVVLTATSNFNCTNSSFQFVTVNPKPSAYFISVQPSACTHTIGFINTSNVSGGSITSSNWSYGDGNTASSQNGSNNYINNGTYNAQLIVTSNMGCLDTAIIPVTISPLPTAAFNANSVCLNGISTFTNSSSVTSGFINTVNWTFGDGSQSFLNQPTHQYAGAGTYNVTLNITTNSNCSNSITQQVTVNPLPTVLFTANNVCDGNAVNFFNTSSITSGSISNYMWDYTSDGIPDNTNQVANTLFTTPGTYTTQLMAISNFNCSATHTAVVIVYPKPVAQFSSAAVCQAVPVTFTNQSTISSGQITYNQWAFGDNTTSTIINPQHLYTGSGNYNVTLTATSNFGCASSVSLLALVHPKPIVNFQSTSSCLNQATQFNNQSNILSGAIIKYRWDFENNGIIDDSTANPSHIYPSAGTQQSRLVAVSNNSCVSQSLNPVVVHYNPVANFSAPSTCLPGSSQFNDISASSDGNITSYNWDFNGDNIIDNNQQNPQYIYTQAGNYGVKLEVQTQYGCINTVIKSAYVNTTPSALFAAQNNAGCPSLCVQFVNNSTIGSGNIVTNQWIFGDNSNPDYSQNPTHCYSTGNYNVELKVVSDSGCISSLTLPGLVNVYPVPTANFKVTPEEIEITTPMIEVEDKSVGASTVKYTFNDGTIQNTPNFSYTFNTDVAKMVYIQQLAINSYGCRDSLIKQVEIKPAYTIYIPNAFTPNSDGLNDGFKAVGVGISQFKLQVFDRWGALVFETTDINNAWDGSIKGKGDMESTKQEVYVWKAQVTDVLSEKHSMIGNVTLVK
ncbi:MAG: PKD domain-containing protein [Bacteroidota bacterium]